ncbi:hypothetical protein BDZ91DRAFT_712206 [Kalaharituber pfeilii]|nr:hypothetical protein BDZ91DRAFT_712206 [Kalaharituber pfeilii]
MQNKYLQWELLSIQYCFLSSTYLCFRFLWTSIGWKIFPCLRRMHSLRCCLIVYQLKLYFLVVVRQSAARSFVLGSPKAKNLAVTRC